MLTPGQQIFGKYLLLDKLRRKTKDGKDMYNIKLGDATGEINAVVWENCPITGDFSTGGVIGVLGDLGSFNGKLQVTAKRIKMLEEDPNPYLKGPTLDLATLQPRFEQYIDSVQDLHLQDLLRRIFDPAQKERF